MSKFNKIKTEIALLSGQQRYWKPRRKTLSTIENPKSPEEATNIVQTNKYELRHLFQAYAILKGTTRPEIKRPSNYNGQILNQSKVDALVEKFKPETVE